MSMKSEIQQALIAAMKNKDTVRLECLRMAKAALLLKEKETAKDSDLSDEDAVKTLRAEVRKRRQSIETYAEVGKGEEVAKLEAEIAVLDEFLPTQLTEAQLEEKVRDYLEANPDVTHAGKLTGVMMKGLGDQADGKVLNAICRRVLES